MTGIFSADYYNGIEVRRQCNLSCKHTGDTLSDIIYHYSNFMVRWTRDKIVVSDLF